MTESSKDEVLGRAYRRQGEIEEELRLCTLEAQRIGKLLTEVGSVLVRAPQNVVFEKESFSGPFRADCTIKQSDQKDISADRVRALTNDFRRLIAEKENLEATLKH